MGKKKVTPPYSTILAVVFLRDGIRRPLRIAPLGTCKTLLQARLKLFEPPCKLALSLRVTAYRTYPTYATDDNAVLPPLSARANGCKTPEAIVKPACQEVPQHLPQHGLDAACASILPSRQSGIVYSERA